MQIESRVDEMVSDLLEASGPLDRTVPLFDLGADSLVFVELSHVIKVEFGVLISVQQLFEDVVTISAIARWVEENRPVADSVAPPVAVVAAVQAPVQRATGARTFDEATKASASLSTSFESVLCNNRRIAERGNDVRERAYPIWVGRSEGPFIWDVDGNKVIDLAMGYGAHLFGHNPHEVMDAIRNQLDRGNPPRRRGRTDRPAGGAHSADDPQRTCQLLRHGHRGCIHGNAARPCLHGSPQDRHSERRVPRSLGLHVVRAAARRPKGLRRDTVYSGRVPSSAEGVLVAAWDDPELSRFLRENCEQIAAVLIEPMQNQNPDWDLGRLVGDLRAVTEEIGALLVFDEILTGFRFAVGGFQEIFGVRADIVLYGKVVAAGMPISVVAGRADVLDLIDGGPWTQPMRADESRLTFTAGTYAKHPLSMAAGLAVLRRLQASGHDDLRELNARGDELRERLERTLAMVPIGMRVMGRGSFFRFVRTSSTSFAYSGAAFHAFRRALLTEGVYIAESGNCFLSTAHSRLEVDEVVAAVSRAVMRLLDEEAGQGDAKAPAPAKDPDVSIAFFGVSYDARGGDVYEQIVGVAELADTLGISAVWLPERHFDGFAGFSPNPAVSQTRQS